MAPAFTFAEGRIPLLVSMPHVGTEVPDDVARHLTPAARALPDTDWHVDRLYDFLGDLGCSVLRATQSRYVIDLNRSADDTPLYPGQAGTGLVPLETFAGEPLYRPGHEPDTEERRRRIATVWEPYHRQLRSTLDRLKVRHGYALLWEAHSIPAVVPRLFAGRLPDINLGTAQGRSCRNSIAVAVLDAARAAAGYTSVLNGRFTGGAITRTYGAPDQGVQAIQCELSQATYLADGSPPTIDEPRAAGIRPVLRAMIESFVAHGSQGGNP